MSAGLAAGPGVNRRHGEIRDLIRKGTIDLPELLEGKGDDALEAEVLRIGIGSLVRAVPGVGRARMAAVLDGVFPGLRTGELTTRRRRRLADAIRREIRS